MTLDQLRSAVFGEVVQGQGSLIMLDPPRHERMRKLVSRAFTPRRIAAWEPVVARVIGGFLDRLDGASSFDVVVDFAGPFPVEVICEIVGVPAGDRQQIRHWTDAMLEREVGNPFPTDAGIESALAMGEYVQRPGRRPAPPPRRRHARAPAGGRGRAGGRHASSGWTTTRWPSS